MKLLENTFRHVNIALVNELAMFARDLGVDIWSAIDAAATKPFGFMRFTPGPGVGGHCLPIDPSYLAWRVERRLGTRFRFVELANDVNEHMPDYVVQRVVAMLNGEARAVSGSRILVLGLAYKPGTSDWRESPAMTIVERLQRARRGRACARRARSRRRTARAGVERGRVLHGGARGRRPRRAARRPPRSAVRRRSRAHARLVLDTRARLRGHEFRGEVL